MALGALGVAVTGLRPTQTHQVEANPSPLVPVLQGEPDSGLDVIHVPKGEPPRIRCVDARAVVAQTEGILAFTPEPINPKELTEGITDWLDPHGFWSVPSDSPIGAALRAHASGLAADLTGTAPRSCDAARAIAAVTKAWVDELRASAEEGRALAESRPPNRDLVRVMAEELPEGRSTRALAKELGLRLGFVRSRGGPALAPAVDAAVARFFPALDLDGWTEVVIAATLRSFVPLWDPHGAWAPFEEEANIYDLDLSARAPTKLWSKATVTAFGVRIDEANEGPLAAGDVLLALGGQWTAGMSIEQVIQLELASVEDPHAVEATVWRPRAGGVIRLPLSQPPQAGPASDPTGLRAERVAYADGAALIVKIDQVREDLGEELGRVLRKRDGALGLLLDLRGNGGGSSDAASAALGYFLPGAPLFPMQRKDGTVEIEHAPEIGEADRFSGPVAVLVDGATASAAEMIAGALAAYGRAQLVGARTYGKGCAQEYLEDEAHVGVLRLTTLLFALPDGSPVQRVGLSPTIPLSLEASPQRLPKKPSTTDPDREALLPHAPPSWSGPDVRVKDDRYDPVSWPAHAGKVGPCKAPEVCRALRAIGAGSPKRVARTR